MIGILRLLDKVLFIIRDNIVPVAIEGHPGNIYSIGFIEIHEPPDCKSLPTWEETAVL